MHENLITRLRRRIGAVLAAKQMLGWLAALGVRLGHVRVPGLEPRLNDAPDWLWWGIAAAPVVGLAAASSQSAGCPRGSAAGRRWLVPLRRTLDDGQGAAGPWQQTMPTPRELEVLARGGRAWGTFLLGVLFFDQPALPAAARLVDPRSGSSKSAPTPSSSRPRSMCSRRKSCSSPSGPRFLKERLKQLKDEASGKNPIKTLEAADHVRNMVTQAAKEAAETAVEKGKLSPGREPERGPSPK